MIFALLGDILIGDAVWTGPNAAKESRKATLVEHKVARGKPPVQDMGDELDGKTLEFFFDETFCDPVAELSKLQAAFADRAPLAYVAGDGSFEGVRWMVESLDVETLKSTPLGRPVRMKVSTRLKETPADSPLTFFAALARAGASALGAFGVGAIGARR
ncbi:MAG: phage tail protein [Rhizobiales bacterium]|nr:phage tail protein [Hyphomicrobiales bacterium]